jgi:hypothetical protein
MRFRQWWTAARPTVEQPNAESAVGRELWERTLASDPDCFIPLVWCAEHMKQDRARVSLSSGTISLQKPESDELKYNPGAFVPAKPWRKPTDRESNGLWRDSGFTGVDFVGITKVPDDLLAEFNNVERDGSSGPLWRLESNRIDELSRPLVNYLCKGFGYKKDPVRQGVSVNMPALETVTFDANRAFLGLHLDSWDGQPLETRVQSLNRIVVNIGSEARYFLFLNLSLMEMARALTLRPGTVHGGLNWLGPAFMARFPRYPIVRVRVAPGEAYIAPTDNVIHDASTIDSKGPSVSFTVRGWFIR